MSAKCEQLFQKCYHNDWVSHEEKASFIKNCNTKQPGRPNVPPPAPPSAFAMSASGNVTYQDCRSYIGKNIHREVFPIQSPFVAPILGAAAFVGLTLAAGYRLVRFGDTSLLQRLIPAL